MTEHLIIVSSDKPQLFERLCRQFAEVENVQVILDRRRTAQWQHPTHEVKEGTDDRRRLIPRTDWFSVVPRTAASDTSPTTQSKRVRVTAESLHGILRAVRLARPQH